MVRTINICTRVKVRGDPEGTPDRVPEAGQVATDGFNQPTDDEEFEPILQCSEGEQSGDKCVEVSCNNWRGGI